MPCSILLCDPHERCSGSLNPNPRILIISIHSCWIMINFKKIFKKAFLPNGYPKSVSQDYFQYQCWDSVQAFASSIMNHLATRAIFQGVGVGDANATVLAATMTWILKDGTSIIGSLLFATIQSTRMDSDCKRWRLFADIINDIAIFVDLLSPLCLKSLFIWIQCLSSVLRSLVGIAGGATRAALTQHQAKCNNMADVSAKDQSQERIVNLLALVFSLLIIPLISERSLFIWIMFSFFTTVHIYANYRAVKSVQIEIFNAKRLAIFLENYFNNDYANLSVPSINQQENVLFFLRRKHDKIFEQVRFYRKPCDLDGKTCYATDRYVVLIDEEYPKFKIFIPEPSPMLIIETLCFIYRYQMFLEQNRDTQPTVAFSSHDEDFTKIAILMHQNGWDVKSHVLMAELFDDEDDDRYHLDSAKKSN